ncbi:MAG: hypothetical protein VX028_00450 [Nanoarchaeota archaeon]|nr:hypothetical protein [Nanoarchaeota archaeon]MEC8339985.1 hypothetical protein [Nanoarchaeota archaeon]
MALVEENKHNPTITKFRRSNSKNHFIVKYKNEEERNAYSEIILRLAKNYELDDFHIEEAHAYQESRVLYNFHTVLNEGEFSYGKLESGFLRYFDG